MRPFPELANCLVKAPATVRITRTDSIVSALSPPGLRSSGHIRIVNGGIPSSVFRGG